MKVFVAVGYVGCEGSTVFGVYSDKKQAERETKKILKTKDCDYDDYEIIEKEINITYNPYEGI